MSQKHASTKPPSGPPPPARRDDEVLHVPRGQRKVQFLILLGLSILTLVIFTVGDMIGMLGQGGGGGKAELFMSWEHPRLGRQELTWPEFQQEMRRTEGFLRTQGQEHRRIKDEVTPDRVAYRVITEALALEAGIDVSERELATAILQGDGGRMPPFQSRETYRQMLEFAGIDARSYERAALREMRIDRYENLIAAAIAMPDPDAIEKVWKEVHKEFAFELAQAKHEACAEAAAAALPADEELKAWYEALAPDRRQMLFSEDWLKERWSAEIASFTLDAAQEGGEVPAEPAALLQKYPLPEGADPEAMAKGYYDSYRHVRFKRTEPLAEAQDELAKLYLPYDEVKERAGREARVRGAFEDWRKDLEARIQAGETIDLEAQAGELGLAFERVAEPLTQEQWRQEVEGEGNRPVRGPFLAAGLPQAQASGLPLAPIVEEDAIALSRRLAYEPAGQPPFEAVREKVAEQWKKEKAGALAVEKLETLRKTLLPEASLPEASTEVPPAPEPPQTVDSATFAAKAAEAGVEVARRDWYDPGEDAQDSDPDAPAEVKFLRMQFLSRGEPFLLEEGKVSAVLKGEGSAWLVRSGGTRDPSEVRIKPAELRNLKTQVYFEGMEAARENVLTERLYYKRYGLKLYTQEEPEKEREPAGS